MNLRPLVIGVKMNKQRKRCTYPMSLFHNFEDEVPRNARLSTPEDCEDCEEGSIINGCNDSRLCLIEGLPTPHPCPDE